MKSRLLLVASLCLLAACGRQQQAICGCPPPPLPAYLAVAERGANEIAIYPLGSGTAATPDAVISAPPAVRVPAPGADSLLSGPGLYVGEYPSTIAIFNVTAHGALGIALTASGAISSAVNDPAAMAVGPVNGSASLLVANRGANTIAVYAGVDNAPSGFAPTPALTLSGLNAPNGLAFDGKGNLWVSQASDVVEFTPPFAANAAPARVITSGLQSPDGIAFDWTGTMYVADKGMNAILVYPAGAATPSLAFNSGIDGPGSIALDGSYLYVPNAAGNDVAEYRLPLSASSQPIATNAVDMNQPTALAIMY